MGMCDFVERKDRRSSCALPLLLSLCCMNTFRTSHAFRPSPLLRVKKKTKADHSRSQHSKVFWSANEEQPVIEQEETPRPREVRFISPLLEYGYRPAVEEYENKSGDLKPLLLYLPGFDGTFICPFLQFPELGTIFDVRCMTVAANDRSTFDELRETVLDYLKAELCNNEQGGGGLVNLVGLNRGTAPENEKLSSSSSSSSSSPHKRPLYLAGESFGGILASEVAISILEDNTTDINLQGLALINSATCYDRSKLIVEGPSVAELPLWLYPAGLIKLLPVFTDEYSMDQLFLILQGKAMPSVIDNATREAYLGRVAISLPCIIPVLWQGTFRWRLTAWLETGCDRLALRLQDLKRLDPSFRTLIVAGEHDRALPSIDEAERLSTILPNPKVHVVEGAGHASTCGSRVELAALFRSCFEELQDKDLSRQSQVSRKQKQRQRNDADSSTTTTTPASSRTRMKDVAASGKGAYFGMEPRYDGKTIGLSPLLYWSRKYHRKYKPKQQTSQETTTRTLS